MNEYDEIVDKLLNMDPDPIPKYVLLKEFKNVDKNNPELNDLYEMVCAHKFVKKIEESLNGSGFWDPFHGLTEHNIRLLLSYGLDKNHPVLKNVLLALTDLLRGKMITGQSEKQDHPLWYPIMFEPLIFASMIALIDPENNAIINHRRMRAGFAEAALGGGVYDEKADAETQRTHYGFNAKRFITPFCYFNLLLLRPGDTNRLSAETDDALVDYCMKESDLIYYVYNNKPCDFVEIGAQNRDARSFWHWIRALSLISQFNGWKKYEKKYSKWIMDQRNSDGFWEFPKKFYYTLSDSWRGKNKAIDSTIFVLRMLMKKRAF